MGYRAIALSQVDGAGGESIGHDLAERLSFGYLNEAIISRVARDYGVTTAAVAEAERRKSFLSRVAEMAALGSMAGVVPDAAPYIFDETDALLSMIREAVRDAAARGDVVLVAHAACYACADAPDVLRVCVTAPLSVRAARVAAERGIDEKEAAKLLRRSDVGRAAYLKRVYGVEEESPSDYDVVVNTERLSMDDAVGLVTWLVQSRSAPTPSADEPVGASG